MRRGVGSVRKKGEGERESKREREANVAWFLNV